jgi:multidrug resistance efflux pump
VASFEGRPHPHSHTQHRIDEKLASIDKGERKRQYREAARSELGSLWHEHENLKIDLEVAEAKLAAARAQAESRSAADPKHVAREAARAYIAEGKRETYVPQPAPFVATPEFTEAEAAVASIKQRLETVGADLAEQDKALRARFAIEPED